MNLEQYYFGHYFFNFWKIQHNLGIFNHVKIMSHKLCNSLQDFPIPFARFKLSRLSNVVPTPLYIQTLKHSTTTLLLLFSALPLCSSTSYIYNDFEGWEGKEITHFSSSTTPLAFWFVTQSGAGVTWLKYTCWKAGEFSQFPTHSLWINWISSWNFRL